MSDAESTSDAGPAGTAAASDIDRLTYDVVVVGAGGSGLRAAIEARLRGKKTAIISKSLFGKAHTVMAEGGCAAAMGNVNPNDNWKESMEAESPYLAYIVGLHVATAIAMIIFFWRDWVRIVGAFFASIRHVLAPEPGTRRFEPQGTDQTLAWMIILATIPVGIAGLLLEHTFRTVFSRPLLTSSFLFVNGLILLAGERARRRGADAELAAGGLRSADGGRAADGHRRRGRARSGRRRPALVRAAGAEAGAGEPRGAG